MANSKNLIPISSRPQRERIAIAKKGGKVKSPKKKWAARMRELKKKGLSNDNYKRIVAWMDDPDSSTLDIFLYVESIKKHCQNPNQMTNVARALIDLKKSHHGDKSQPNVNIQINNIMTGDQRTDIIGRLIKE